MEHEIQIASNICSIKLFDHDFLIHHNSSIDRFYLLLPIDVKKTISLIQSQIISLDPGSRTFLSGYSNNHHTLIKFGENNQKQLSQLHQIINKLQSKLTRIQGTTSTKTNKIKSNIQKAINRIYHRIHNLITQLHDSSIDYLTSNFNLILLPKFQTSCMIKKSTIKKIRKLTKSTCLNLNNLRHYEFQQKIIYKSHTKSNCKILIVDESFTSKTCSNCGTINHQLGSKSIFNCSECHFSSDRDIQGAINIYLKYITENHQNLQLNLNPTSNQYNNNSSSTSDSKSEL